MAAVLDAVNSLLASGEHRHILTTIKAFRNGAVYGAKVRFPHALVMTFLFKNGSLRSKIEAILQATYTHSRNLALFVFSYKALTSCVGPIGDSKSNNLYSFLAAFCAGFAIFGRYNKINEQINLYVLSRVLYGLSKLLVHKKVIPQTQTDLFPWISALLWGLTLWLFEYEKSCLQPSLVSSMTYLYKDCEKWTSLRNFLIYNE